MARILLRPKDTDKLSARFRAMARQLPNAVDTALRSAADDMGDDFSATWADWSHKPTLNIEPRGSGNGYNVTVDDDIWNMLNVGTKPHSIDGDPLSFVVNGDRVFTTHVDHPGTKAKGWGKEIGRRWQPRVPKYVRDALKAGMEAIGL